MEHQHEVAEQLRQLSRLYVNAEKYRNKYGNMLLGKTQYLESSVEKEWEQIFSVEMGKHHEFEGQLKKKIEKLLKDHPWSKYLLAIKGIGPIIAASIIGELNGYRYGSIEKGQKITKSDILGYGRLFKSTADLWSYAGWGVKDGKAKRITHGEKSNWNKYLKLTMYKAVVSFIKSKGPYRKVYDDRKAYEKVTSPDLTKGHIENRTRRFVIKKFLSDIRYQLLGNEGYADKPKGELRLVTAKS